MDNDARRPETVRVMKAIARTFCKNGKRCVVEGSTRKTIIKQVWFLETFPIEAARTVEKYLKTHKISDSVIIGIGIRISNYIRSDFYNITRLPIKLPRRYPKGLQKQVTRAINAEMTQKVTVTRHNFLNKARAVFDPNAIRCTIGKDQLRYYFQNGRRISNKKAGEAGETVYCNQKEKKIVNQDHKCTIGKDGKEYYFHKGRRVSRRKIHKDNIPRCFQK